MKVTKILWQNIKDISIITRIITYINKSRTNYIDYSKTKVFNIIKSFQKIVIKINDDIKTLYGHSFNPIFIIITNLLLFVIMRQSIGHCSLGDQDGNVQYPGWLKTLANSLLSDMDNKSENSDNESSTSEGSNNAFCESSPEEVMQASENIDAISTTLDLCENLSHKLKENDHINRYELKQICVKVIAESMPLSYYPISFDDITNKNHIFTLIIKELLINKDDSNTIETLAVMLIDSANHKMGIRTELDPLNNVKHFDAMKSNLDYFTK